MTKSKTKTRPYDVAEYLDSPEMMAEYITEAFATDDKKIIAKAIGAVARAKGMASIASRAGLSRESLYKSFDGETKTEFDTVQKVLEAMDLRLVVEPRGA